MPGNDESTRKETIMKATSNSIKVIAGAAMLAALLAACHKPADENATTPTPAATPAPADSNATPAAPAPASSGTSGTNGTSDNSTMPNNSNNAANPGSNPNSDNTNNSTTPQPASGK